MPAPVERVSAKALRALFNDGRYYERLQEGEFHLGEIVDVGRAPARFPAGTRSQMVTYLNEQNLTVVIAHQYGRQDGTPALGTKPDPKFMFERGVRYKFSPYMR
jgi:hypothetical protein